MSIQELDSASHAMQDSLNAELKGKHDFAVHIASPGMVATELLLGGEEKDQGAAKIINILAEEAEVVAAWLVPRMRGVRRSGKYFKCESPLTVVLCLLHAMVWVQAKTGKPGLPCFC
jgi:chlorophyll(ide) b reductase